MVDNSGEVVSLDKDDNSGRNTHQITSEMSNKNLAEWSENCPAAYFVLVVAQRIRLTHMDL